MHPASRLSKRHTIDITSQVFRFSTSKNESLFLQRKNPRKISWTVPYRRLHKKGITEEIAKKRSRKTVKHQRGVVGADMASITAKRNQSTQVRTAQRAAAIQKAKSEKKEKEAKKTKVQFHFPPRRSGCTKSTCEGLPTPGHDSTQDLEAAGKGRKEWSLVVFAILDPYAVSPCTCTREDR